MKTILFSLIALIFGTSAFAEGFDCTGTRGTVIQVTNENNPAKGTRVAAHMVVRSPSLKNPGRMHRSDFTKANGLLTSRGATYYANVDSRYSDVSPTGNIAGMKYENLQTIRLDVAFNYYWDTPSHAGDKYGAMTTYFTERGTKIYEKMICTRTLKN